MGFSIDCEFGEIDAERLEGALELLPGQAVQKAIDRSVIDWCVPYCPWRTGDLALSPYTASDIGSGTVIYGVPYAGECYYGEKYQSFSTAVNPLAGSFWFDRAMADHAGDVFDAALEAARRKE